MDNYVVGSVADIISQCISPKVKSKKRKISTETTKSETGETKQNVTDCLTKTVQLESKKKLVKHKKGDEISVETPKKKKKKTEVLENQIEPKPKKRKKKDEEISSAEKEDIKIKKKKDIILDLNPVPSDSEKEEEDSENVEKNPKKKNIKSPNKKKEYKDFTDCTVFVGNIPIDYDKQKICKVFSKFGKIISARIRCVPIAEINMSKKVAAVKKKFNPKRNSLVAYVKYETQDSANLALNANGMIVDGHHLRVDLAEENKERDNNKAVFVGGLPFDIEDDELWEFFEKCGKIKSVRVIRDSQTSMGKGFGYVNFESSASVELALQLDGEELKKRNINVKRCTKGRNKNKVNAFGKMKSKEMTNQLLCKKGKKFKREKKKSKMEGKPASSNFQGNKANVKQKKKKKLSKAALHKRKIIKILGAS